MAGSSVDLLQGRHAERHDLAVVRIQVHHPKAAVQLVQHRLVIANDHRAAAGGDAGRPVLINAIVQADASGGYVVSCVELPVVTQGDTFDQLLRNLEEAVYLALRDGDAAAIYGLADDVAVVVTYELAPVYA